MNSERRWSAAIIAAYAAVHCVAVNASWFPADDAQELAFVRLAEGWFGLLGVDAFGLFRPVKNLLFLLFSTLEPLGMPAVRIAATGIGIATFFPVREFFRCVFPDRRYALAASAIWMLSPTLVSSVVWLSCVNIQLMCGFAAAALACHCRERPALASVFMLAACLSYEMAVAAGPCIVAFDFFLRPSRIRERKTWCRYAGYAAVTVAFLALRHFAGSVHSVNGSFANCTRADMIFASAYFSCQHFLSWIWPFGRMTVFGGYAAGSVPSIVLVVAWMSVLSVAAVALWLRHRRPVMALGLAMTLVGFLPVSNITGVGNGPYGDYYLGVSALGLAILFAELSAFRVGKPVVVTLRLAAFAAAFQWAWLWSDGDRAFLASAGNMPGFFGNKIFLTTRLSDLGMWKEALTLGEEVEATVGSDSGQMSNVYLVRGLHALRISGDAQQALAFFDRSRKGDDFGGKARNRDFYVGCVYDDLLNDPSRAESYYVSALRGKWGADSVPVADRLARLLAIKGDLASAISIWERALLIEPDNRTVQHNLNQARGDRAAESLDEARAK